MCTATGFRSTEPAACYSAHSDARGIWHRDQRNILRYTQLVDEESMNDGPSEEERTKEISGGELRKQLATGRSNAELALAKQKARVGHLTLALDSMDEALERGMEMKREGEWRLEAERR